MNATSTPRPDITPLSSSDRKARALQRLEASRSKLIVHIYPDPERRVRSHAAGESDPVADWSGVASLMARVERNGVVNAVWRTARALGRRWWTRQPWHASVDLVASTLAHEAQPILRRHPWASLAAAAAAGAAVVVVLPWTTRALKARAQPWRDNLGNLLWQQLGQAPVQLALAGALTAWVTETSQRAARAPSAAAPTPVPRPEAPPAMPG